MPRHSPTRFLHLLFSDEEGAGFLELALVLPILLVLLLGTVDASRFVAAKLDLEQAAQRTTDLALSARPRSSNGTYLVTEATTASGAAAADVVVEIYLECNAVRKTDFNSGCATGEARARYVSVAISQNIDPVMDWYGLAQALGFQGLPRTIRVTGDSLVRFQ